MEIQVKSRTVLGKRVRARREAGFIPGEIFGRGLPNRHIEVAEKEFTKLYKKAGEHTVITAVTENGEKIPVLISSLAREPISGKFLAVDFHQIRMDEKIQTKIPIVFVGVAPAVKAGLVLVKVMEEIEIESLPGKIPAALEADLAKLENAGESIHVSDLKVPAGVKVLAPDEMVVVTVTEKAKEEVEAPKPSPEAEAVPTAEGGEVPLGAPAENAEKKQ